MSNLRGGFLPLIIENIMASIYLWKIHLNPLVSQTYPDIFSLVHESSSYETPSTQGHPSYQARFQIQ
jgi:hypothetical protein